MDKIEASISRNRRLRLLSTLLEWGNRRRDDTSASLGKFSSDEGDPLNVGVSIVAGEAELGGEAGSDGLSEKQRDRSASLLIQGDLKRTGNGILSGILESGEEHGETLPRAGRMGLSEDSNNFGV